MWQPIETAPKDGTTLDLRRETKGVRWECRGRWVQHQEGASWIGEHGGFLTHEPPTHWRPINLQQA